MAKIIIKRRRQGSGGIVRNIAKGIGWGAGAVFGRSAPQAPAYVTPAPTPAPTPAAPAAAAKPLSPECEEAMDDLLEEVEDIFERHFTDPNLTTEQRAILSDVYRELQTLRGEISA